MKLNTSSPIARTFGSSGSKIRSKVKKPTLLRAFPLGAGLPNLLELEEEIDEMREVLLGRLPPPIDVGVMTLYETADAYYARICEITIEIQRCEREGQVMRGSKLYKFRTGELRTMADLTKSAAGLGSRRLAAEQLRFEQALRGHESV